MCVITSQRSREGCQKTKEDEVEKGRGFYQDGLTGVLRDTGCTRHSGFPLLADAGQQLLDLGDRPARVQSLGTGLGAIHDGVASEKGNPVNTLVPAKQVASNQISGAR